MIMETRCAEISRKTGETNIFIKLNLDGSGKRDISTGIGFFDHMLDQLSRHSLIDITVQAKGDLHIDDHHLVEDTGIALGTAFGKAIGDKSGIQRFGWASVPLDEALVIVSLDISGRGMSVTSLGAMDFRVGDFTTQLVPEFLRAFATTSGITLHARAITGENTHHIIEACFKALAQALKSAVKRDDRISDIPSTKGVL